MQRGISNALKFDIKASDTAVDFLYGRIYDYLSILGKKIFIAIGQLIQTDDRTGSLNIIKYALDMEKDEDSFSEGLNELIKLKVIELTTDGIYRVYSNEILKIMKKYYSERGNDFPTEIFEKHLEQLRKSSSNDVEKMLLENANNARFTQSKKDVINNYENILSRDSAPMEIKLEALIQYTSYLYNELADYEATLKLMNSNYSLFKNQPEYIQFYSSILWASKLKEQAIKVLEKYVDGKEIKSNIDIEIFCSLAIKKSIYIIDVREELKNSYGYDGSFKLKQQKKSFFDYLERIGRPLIQYLYITDIENIDDKLKQNLFTAIYHSIDVFCRVSKLIEILGHKNMILSKFKSNKEYYNKLDCKFFNIERYKRNESCGKNL